MTRPESDGRPAARSLVLRERTRGPEEGREPFPSNSFAADRRKPARRSLAGFPRLTPGARPFLDGSSLLVSPASAPLHDGALGWRRRTRFPSPDQVAGSADVVTVALACSCRDDELSDREGCLQLLARLGACRRAWGVCVAGALARIAHRGSASSRAAGRRRERGWERGLLCGVAPWKLRQASR